MKKIHLTGVPEVLSDHKKRTKGKLTLIPVYLEKVLKEKCLHLHQKAPRENFPL